MEEIYDIMRLGERMYIDRRVCYPTALRQTMHSHTLDELVIVETGCPRVLIADNVYRPEGAFVLFFPAGEPHQQLNDPTRLYSRYCIDYDRAALTELLPPDFLPRSFFVLPLTAEEYADLARYLCLMFGEETEEQFEVCRHLLAIVLRKLASLLRTRLSAAGHIHSAGDKTLLDVCRRINEDYARPLTLESLAAEQFVSRAKLVRLFRDGLGMTVNDYLTDVRISRAKGFLREGRSVAETAVLCGYACTGYFIRRFRDHTGITPAKYRREIQWRQMS
ncbi:MAG: helix-turn-helix transcriptional regulator [Clostridia bacterium]|nr:helix-turn-helix transcriptional regulator [Clostridia bacterium]